MAKFVTIGERLSTTAPAVNKAFTERDPEPILKRAKQQLDAGATYVDVAAANDAIVIALCNGEGIAKDNDERMMYMQTLMERGMEHGMDVENDMWFDPLFLVIKGMQDKQMEVLEFI